MLCIRYSVPYDPQASVAACTGTQPVIYQIEQCGQEVKYVFNCMRKHSLGDFTWAQAGTLGLTLRFACIEYVCCHNIHSKHLWQDCFRISDSIFLQKSVSRWLQNASSRAPEFTRGFAASCLLVDRKHDSLIEATVAILR